ncbi:MAG: hypothetical protein ACJAXJ_003430 [Colwellia sp.]|jgi:hypothetical protein
MSELTELDHTKHSDLHVIKNSQINFSATQHLLNIRVTEVGQMVCSLPVFLTKDPQHGLWRLSAVTSFALGHNLLVQNDRWMAPYQPSYIQTYPFYLMNSPREEKTYTIGIDESSEVFSTEDGEALFDNSGKGTEFLSRIKTMLEADIENNINTYKFGKEMDALGLCKPINLLISYADNTTQKITGLTTIDEDKLQYLTAENLFELNKKGYLTPIHGMLISMLQLNGLIQKNNNIEALPKIKNIKLEVTK